MRFLEWNRGAARWASEHPIVYALLLGAILGALYLGLTAWLDQPFLWPIMILWVIVFPATIALVIRARSKQQRDS